MLHRLQPAAFPAAGAAWPKGSRPADARGRRWCFFSSDSRWLAALGTRDPVPSGGLTGL